MNRNPHKPALSFTPTSNRNKMSPLFFFFNVFLQKCPSSVMKASLPYILSVPWWIPETFMLTADMPEWKQGSGSNARGQEGRKAHEPQCEFLMLSFNPPSARMFLGSMVRYENVLWWDAATRNLVYTVCAEAACQIACSPCLLSGFMFVQFSHFSSVTLDFCSYCPQI